MNEREFFEEIIAAVRKFAKTEIAKLPTKEKQRDAWDELRDECVELSDELTDEIDFGTS